VVVWGFPLGIAALPFRYFFHPNRQDFYQKHGVVGIDWDPRYQEKIGYAVIVLAAFYFLFIVYVANDFRKLR